MDELKLSKPNKGMVDVIYRGRSRTFSEQLIAQLPNQDVLDYIKRCFDTPN